MDCMLVTLEVDYWQIGWLNFEAPRNMPEKWMVRELVLATW